MDRPALWTQAVFTALVVFALTGCYARSFPVGEAAPVSGVVEPVEILVGLRGGPVQPNVGRIHSVEVLERFLDQLAEGGLFTRLVYPYTDDAPAEPDLVLELSVSSHHDLHKWTNLGKDLLVGSSLLVLQPVLPTVYDLDLVLTLRVLGPGGESVTELVQEGRYRFEDNRVRASNASLEAWHEKAEELVQERTTRLEQEVIERKRVEQEIRMLNEELEQRVYERTVELENALEELKRLDEMKDSFLSSVSHELRTPLTSIRSFSEILLQYDRESPETQQEFLQIINTESERLTRLIDDLLDLARIESREMVYKDTLLSIQQVVDDVVKAQYPLIEQKSLRLTLDISPHLPLVLADHERIQQVVTNLLANAVKFSLEGTEICIRAEAFSGERSGETSEWIKVSVSDQGIGIEEEYQEIIFDKFSQVSEDSLKEKPKGTGLGLPICREIVTRHGGNISVVGQKGEGSNFFFTLPATVVSDKRVRHCLHEEKPRAA